MDGAVTCSVAGDYFVQGVHKWQAPCRDDSAETERIPVYGQWGDNLAGDANFKIGSPIRVELTLWARNPADPPVEGTDPVGYKVVKLEQDKLDRESAYGTWATEGGAGGYTAAAVAMVPLVHDGEATFSVQHADHVGTDVYAVPPGTNPTAEINATGKVVYGYNLRVAEAGDYYITFNLPSVDLTLFGCNHTGDADESCSGQETKLRMTVGTGGGGGGGGGSGGKPTKKPHPINPGKGGGRN